MLRAQGRDLEDGKFKSVLKPEEEAYILTNYIRMSDQEIADKLGLDSRHSIKRFRQRKGLYKKKCSYEDAFGELVEEGGDNEFEEEQSAPPPPEVQKAPPIPESAPPPPGNKESDQEETSEAVSKVNRATDVKYQLQQLEREKEALKKYMGKDIEQFIPGSLFDDPDERDKFLDKFVILKRGFTEMEWKEFIAHWLRYMREHQYDFNIAEDFDDLIALIREIMIQQSIFEKNKGLRTGDAFFQSYMKQYNESVTRMKKFQDSLKLSRRSRKTEKDYDKNSLAEIVALFDREEVRKMMAEADKNDNIELLGYMDKLRKRMGEEVSGEEEISGQESALLMGMSESKLNKITNKGIKVLETK